MSLRARRRNDTQSSRGISQHLVKTVLLMLLLGSTVTLRSQIVTNQGSPAVSGSTGTPVNAVPVDTQLVHRLDEAEARLALHLAHELQSENYVDAASMIMGVASLLVAIFGVVAIFISFPQMKQLKERKKELEESIQQHLGHINVVKNDLMALFGLLQSNVVQSKRDWERDADLLRSTARDMKAEFDGASSNLKKMQERSETEFRYSLSQRTTEIASAFNIVTNRLQELFRDREMLKRLEVIRSKILFTLGDDEEKARSLGYIANFGEKEDLLFLEQVRDDEKQSANIRLLAGKCYNRLRAKLGIGDNT